MRGRNLQRVEQADYVAGQTFDRVRPWSDIREAVPAGIVAQDAKLLRERGNLRVPHREIGAQRIGKHHYGSVRRAVQPAVKARAINLGIGHIESFREQQVIGAFFRQPILAESWMRPSRCNFWDRATHQFPPAKDARALPASSSSRSRSEPTGFEGTVRGMLDELMRGRAPDVLG